MGAAGESLEKIDYQFGLKIADQTRLYFSVDHGGSAAGEVHGGQAQSFVHRHHEVAGAQDAALVAESLGEGLAQDYANIFHGVVLIHLEIAFGFNHQIEAAVVSEELEHMIEETNACRDVITATSIDEETQRDVGFFGLAMQIRFPHCATFSGMRISARTSAIAAIIR